MTSARSSLPGSLHQDHEGNPVPCNAWCEPETFTHVLLLYVQAGHRAPRPGTVVATPFGAATIIDERRVREVPPSPNHPGAHPIVATLRYATDPLTTI